MMDARPRPLGATFSTEDPAAATVRDEPYQNVFIDTGENGVFSLEEFSTVTSHEQMEFVTPEEIASYLVFEIEGRSTGYDVINALDNAVLGPTYRAGMLRHWALEQLNEMEKEHGVHSVAFEMLGPPRNSKLLFEAHLLRLAFPNMAAVRDLDPRGRSATPSTGWCARTPRWPTGVVSVGIPILLDSGRGPPRRQGDRPARRRGRGGHPGEARGLGRATAGWTSASPTAPTGSSASRRSTRRSRPSPSDDTSSRFLRNRRFWHRSDVIQPGKVVGWILGTRRGGRGSSGRGLKTSTGMRRG